MKRVLFHGAAEWTETARLVTAANCSISCAFSAREKPVQSPLGLSPACTVPPAVPGKEGHSGCSHCQGSALRVPTRQAQRRMVAPASGVLWGPPCFPSSVLLSTSFCLVVGGESAWKVGCPAPPQPGLGLAAPERTLAHSLFTMAAAAS